MAMSGLANTQQQVDQCALSAARSSGDCHRLPLYNVQIDAIQYEWLLIGIAVLHPCEIDIYLTRRPSRGIVRAAAVFWWMQDDVGQAFALQTQHVQLK
ncbi:hypothetical protein D9M71_356380 [compost metagenome]